MMQLIQLSFGRAAGLTQPSLNQAFYGLAINIILGKVLPIGNGFGVAFLPL